MSKKERERKKALEFDNIEEIEEVEEVEKTFLKKSLIIFTWKYSPFKIIFGTILLGIIFEGIRGIHVISNKQTLKEVRQNTKRAIIYSTLITVITISILEYNFHFIDNTIDSILSFYTSIKNLF